MKLLHFADLHLDTAFSVDNLPSNIGSWRRVDLRATLGRIVTLARERKVDIVTIGGDLFDQKYASPDLADFLKQQFARLAPIRVFIAPGQHDPYTNDSLYALTEWPENVTVFSQGRLSTVEIAPNIHLWSAAHPPLKEHKDLVDFQTTKQGVNLLLLHAMDVQQPFEKHNSIFFIDTSAIQPAGFDFALLGYHHNGLLWPKEKPFCVYPGSPEPLSFEEADGAHAMVLLTIEKNRCLPELIPINQWHYKTLEVDLTDCESIEDASRLVEKALSTIEEDEERLIVRVTLIGSPDILLDIESLIEAVETKVHLHYECRFSLEYDLEQLSQELTVRGVLVRRLQQRLHQARTDQERNDLLNILHFALQALEGRQVPSSHEVVG